MKSRTIALLIALVAFAFPVAATAQITVPAGGTGVSSVPVGSIVIGGTSLRLGATTSPTVGYITSTSGTSTFPKATISGAISLLGEYISNLTTWFASKADTWLASKSTSNLVEGANLYYTDARVLTYVSGIAKGFFFSTSSVDYWKTQNNFHSTTSADYWDSTKGRWATTSSDYWESTKQRWATTSADYHLASKDKGFFFSTTSSDAWLNTKSLSAFSTTSADYWKSVRNFFSTTSTDYWETQQTPRTADDLTNNSIEDLSDVGAMTEAYGDVLAWNGSTWTDSATSSLFNTAGSGITGLLAGADWTSFNSRLSTTTLGLIDKGFFFSTTSSDAWLLTKSVGGFSTTSADYWQTQRNFFSTSSASGFAAVGLAHSTTSVAYQLLQNVTLGNATATTMFTTTASSTNFAALNATTTKHNSIFATLTNATATALFATTLSASSASTSDLFISNVRGGLASAGPTGSLYSSATTSGTVSSPLTGSFTCIGSCSLGIQQATPSQNGYLSSGDWSSFNSRLSTSTLGLFDKGFFFSTTSINFFAGAGLAHSTTSVAYQLSQNVTLGNATSTNHFAALASSTSLYGAGLSNCSGGNVLTWANGLFGCAADQTGGGGGAWSWTLATNFAVSVNATSTPTHYIAGVFASSTSQFLNINAYGNVGIGTSTPWAKLSIVSNAADPIFVIATSTSGTKDSTVLSISATSSKNGTAWARVAVGTSTAAGSGTGELFPFTVAGPIYSTYAFLRCEIVAPMTNLTNDSAFNSSCQDYMFDEDVAGATGGVTDVIPSNGSMSIALFAGATASASALAAAGDGAAVTNMSTANMSGGWTASSSPSSKL